MRFFAALVIAACSSSAPPPARPIAPPAADAAPAPPPAPPKVTYPGVPSSAAGDQLAWALDAIVNRHGEVEPSEVEAHFTPSFLAKVPSAQVAAVFHRLAGQYGTIAIDHVDDANGKLVAKATAKSGAKLRVIAVAGDSGKLEGLLFSPDDITFASWADASAAISAIAPHTQALVAQLDKGACKPVHELRATDELAIGSAFKLYVLLALADLDWDREIAIRDDWKSLPSGITQNETAGTKLSIHALAERMISISDNTATDHLLYTVGRAKVEAALKTAKHAKPELDVPFLTTRELFLLKLEPTAIDEYLKLPAAKRRVALDKGLAGQTPSMDHAGEWTTARRIDKLEWFASSQDLCRAMATLQQRDGAKTPVLDVLSKNPGVRVDPKVWPYVGFKGGSEPGVVELTWLLRRDDDKWFVIALAFNSDEGGTVEEDKAIPVGAGLVELIGRER